MNYLSGMLAIGGTNFGQSFMTITLNEKTAEHKFPASQALPSIITSPTCEPNVGAIMKFVEVIVI